MDSINRRDTSAAAPPPVLLELTATEAAMIQMALEIALQNPSIETNEAACELIGGLAAFLGDAAKEQAAATDMAIAQVG